MTRLTPEQAKLVALARFGEKGPGHINCAQAVVCFALHVMGRDLDLLTVARYFGGGLAGMGETCGALTGTTLALGLRDLHATEEPDDLAAGTRARLQELLSEFTREFGARRCADLTGCDLSTPEGHDAFVASGANERCPQYVGWMCDRLAPMLLDAGAVSEDTADQVV
jgi:C_GCAxxG_C_C family probable redox protein